MEKPVWYNMCLPQKQEDGSFEHIIGYLKTSGYSGHKLIVDGHRGIAVIAERYQSHVFEQEVEDHLEILQRAARHMNLDLQFNHDNTKCILCATVTAKDRTYVSKTIRTYTFRITYEYGGEDDFKMVTEAAKIYLDWCVKKHRLPIDRMINWLFNTDSDYCMMDYDCELIRKINKEQEEKIMRAEREWAKSKISSQYYCIIHINLMETQYLSEDNFQCANQIAKKSRTKIIVGKKGTVLIQANKEEYVKQGIKELSKSLKREFENIIISNRLEERYQGMTERQRKLASYSRKN